MEALGIIIVIGVIGIAYWMSVSNSNTESDTTESNPCAYPAVCDAAGNPTNQTIGPSGAVDENGNVIEAPQS